jgi:hypothetical protein
MAAIRIITEERAERIARSIACSHCLEYSFKKLRVRRAPPSHKDDLKTVWIATRTCGVCGHEQEIGLDAHGEVIYGG